MRGSSETEGHPPIEGGLGKGEQTDRSPNLTYSGELKGIEDETAPEKEAREAVRARISKKIEELVAALQIEQNDVKKTWLRRDIQVLRSLEAALGFAGTDPLGLLKSKEEELRETEDEINRSKPRFFDNFATKSIKKSALRDAENLMVYHRDSIKLLKEAADL